MRIKSAVAGAAIALAATVGSASAAERFTTIEGLEATTLTTQEMATVQGTNTDYLYILYSLKTTGKNAGTFRWKHDISDKFLSTCETECAQLNGGTSWQICLSSECLVSSNLTSNSPGFKNDTTTITLNEGPAGSFTCTGKKYCSFGN